MILSPQTSRHNDARNIWLRYVVARFYLAATHGGKSGIQRQVSAPKISGTMITFFSTNERLSTQQATHFEYRFLVTLAVPKSKTADSGSTSFPFGVSLPTLIQTQKSARRDRRAL